MSTRGQRTLWACLGGLCGLVAASELGSGLAASAFTVLAAAAAGAALAPQLSQALPLFGVVVGPLVALTLMNLQRLTTSYTVALPPVTRRGAFSGPTNPTAPSLPDVSTAIGVVASALLAAVLLHALSRKIRGERRPLRQSFRSLAWICFWITLVMILISNFAPL
jgi:hypothetical protein